MQHSRRRFIRTGALAIAGSALLSKNGFANFRKPNEIVGIQLYSVRDAMSKEPLVTLQALAKMGYKHVEHANYVDRKFYGYGAKEFRKVLDDLGMKMESGHTVMRPEHWDASKKDFADSWKRTVEDAAICGQKYVISPSIPETVRKNKDNLMQTLEQFNKSGELCNKSGMKFGYHNHDFEFSEKFGEQTLYEIILENTDPKLVMQQLDMGNMVNGGAMALDVMRKYPNRFESMHVKDEIPASTGHEKYESTILGKGIVKTKDVIDLGRKYGGTTHFIIEQESYQGKDPMDCAREDLEIMNNWGYK